MATIDKELAKLLGSDDFMTSESTFMSTGLVPLDILLSGEPDGGFAEGRIYEIYGPESSGKTAMATMAMIAAQRAGGIGIFVDYERTFEPKFAKEMGLTLERPSFIYIKPTTWEEGNTKSLEVAQILRGDDRYKDKPIVIVQDSIAAAVPKSVVEKGIDELNMNDTTALARVTSSTLKAVNVFVDEFNVVMIYLNQVREKIGVMFGNPETTPGGKAMKFYASVRISLSKKQTNEGGHLVKHEIKAKVVKNKITQSVGQTVSWDLRYERKEGEVKSKAYIDATGSLVDYMKDNKFLETAGAYIVYLDGKKYHRATLVEHIDKNNLKGELIEFLKGKIRAASE